MNVGLLILRLMVGLILAGHGAQKLFGWFGGGGLQGTGGFFAKLGMRPGPFMAFLAGMSEFGGGLLLAFGLVTSLGAAAVVGVMTVAILSVHLSKGLWNSNGGFELPLINATAAAVLAFAGPGAYSIDHAAGWNLAGVGWGIAAVTVGLVAGLSVNGYRLAMVRRTAMKTAPAPQAERDRPAA